MTDIVGRWEIVSWEQVYDDGRRLLPMGERPTGFIQYDADGHMAVLIADGDRPRFTSGGQWDASDAEKAAAYRSMLAYSGTWELDGDQVLHHIEVSLYPNWVGGIQRRTLVSNSDGTIELQARIEDGTPQARTAVLTWRRGGTASS